MELLDGISKRRSVRKFTDQVVDREVLNNLVKAGMQAPSASNLQAWRFVIVDDPLVVKKIKRFSPGLVGDPQAIIIICSDYGYAESRKSGTHYKEYGCIMDASMAAENIMLVAVDAGLGTCAIKSYTEKAVRKIVQLPSDIHLEILLSVGYPDGELRMVKRKPFEDNVHYNVWEKKV